MSVIKSQINPRSEEFRANAGAMRTMVDDLRAKAAEVSLGGGEAARANMRVAANCCRATASTTCSIRGPAFSRSARWRPSACTTTTHRRPE